MKIVLDSNIIISAFASRGLCLNVFEICLDKHTVILSQFLLQEIHRNLQKRIKLPLSLCNEIQNFLLSEAKIVEPQILSKNSCRDQTDIKVLGTGITGQADAIVTGDNDLLVLKEFHSIPILLPRKFWEFIQKDKTQGST